MNRILKALIKAFYPQRCAYCGKPIAHDALMCIDCEKTLPRIEGKVCDKCGREKKVCSCKNAENNYKRLVSPFYFSGNVRKGIHAFKFRKCPDNAEAYSFEMAKVVNERLSDIKFDFITEIPMTAKSEKRRGYNQCELLAKGIGEILGIEHKKNILVKLYETPKQHSLKLFLRKGNLTGVFDVKDLYEVDGKTILLCDDISTTGETLNECAKMLWLYGAKEVYCVAVALTRKNKLKK